VDRGGWLEVQVVEGWWRDVGVVGGVLLVEWREETLEILLLVCWWCEHYAGMLTCVLLLLLFGAWLWDGMGGYP
jgi:hypothetical protein